MSHYLAVTSFKTDKTESGENKLKVSIRPLGLRYNCVQVNTVSMI